MSDVLLRAQAADAVYKCSTLQSKTAAHFEIGSQVVGGVVDRIRFIDLRFQQAAPGHIEEWAKRRHSLLHLRIVVPFVDPDSAKPQIFENEETGWDFQGLQTHRSKTDQRSTKGEAIGQPQRAIAPNGI